MTREQILNTARDLTCGDRNRTYGPPDIQLECAEELANVLTRYHNLMRQACSEFGPEFRHVPPAEWQALRMVATKLSRMVCGPLYHPDNYIDAAAYAAIAGECAAQATRLEDKANE